MLAAIATGTLTAEPVQRIGANANQFVTAQMRVPTDDGAIVVSVIAFDKTACDALSKLRKGDSLSVTGRATLKTWQCREGDRTGLSVVAEALLTAYQVKSRRASRKGNGTGASRHAEAGYDDWIQP